MARVALERFGILASLGLLLFAGGIARAEPGPAGDAGAVAISNRACDARSPLRANVRSYLAALQSQHPHKLVARHRSVAPHPVATAVRHQPARIVVAENATPAMSSILTSAGRPKCAVAGYSGSACPDLFFLGVNY